MNNISQFILIFLLSTFLSFFLTKIVIFLAKKYNILDNPNNVDRKVHKQPIPLLGGTAIYFSFLILTLIFWQADLLLDQRINISLVFYFLVAGFILIFNGFLDDKYTLPPYISILGPILASLLVILAGLKITYITHPDGGIWYLDNILQFGNISFSLLSGVITFIWLMSLTYTTKLLDGIDGLTSGIGLIASLVIFMVSLSWDVIGSTTSILSLILAGSIFGFLILNWHPAKIFLGEGGSTFIGFSLAVLSIISGSKIATALLVMGLPLLDILVVIVKRICLRKPIWKGDKEHLHFRLLRSGFSHRQIVLFFSTISLSFGLVSIFFTTKIKISALLLLLSLMILLTIWLNIKLKKYEEV